MIKAHNQVPANSERKCDLSENNVVYQSGELEI